MLEYLLIFIRWLICKLIFRNHYYSKLPIYEKHGLIGYKCRICGHIVEQIDDDSDFWFN